MPEIRNTGIVSEPPSQRAYWAAAAASEAAQDAAAAAAQVTVRAAARAAGEQVAPEQGLAAAAEARSAAEAAAASGEPVPRGVFITFEGGDGAGKTTHIRFLADQLRASGRECVCLREPGGTAVGEQLRGVVLSPANAGMTDAAELFVYEAARAQLVADVIAPALVRGAVVLCDRFTDSTVAYQGYGRGLDRAFVEMANDFACQGIRPDRTILLVARDAQEGLARATRRTGADRLERAGADFHGRVAAGFAEIAAADPRRIRPVSSAGPKSRTAAAVFAALSDLFPWMAPLAADPAFFERLDVKRSHEGRIHLRDDAAERADARRSPAHPAGEGEQAPGAPGADRDARRERPAREDG